VSIQEFNSLVINNSDGLKPFAAILTRDNESAKDLFQETIYKAFAHRDQSNTSEIITKQSAILKEAIAKEGIDIQLESAAEYFIDENFENLLKNQVPLLPIHYNMVLVEFSMITAPLDLKEILFEMQLQNYQPVIAHPERYIYLKNKKDFFEELKDHGCFFQLNLLSLLGHYGNSVQELADYLIKNNYYNFAGTDAHNIKHITALQKLAGSSLFKRLQESDTIKNYIL
jgi:tyrosine-protein phosphatase YwqE